jgi:Ca-activated chloride channel family protein
MKQALSMLMLFLCAAFTAFAQSGTISGKITGDNNQPVLGAAIQVLKGKDIAGNASTDVNGNYKVNFLSPGKYAVKVSATGYKTHISTNVIVADNKTTKVNVKLIADGTPKPAPIVRDEEAGDVLMEVQTAKAPESKKLFRTKGTNAGARVQKDVALSFAPPIYSAPTYYNPSNESYKKDPENDFKSVSANPLSTLSVDVDRASYSNVRRFLTSGQMPPADAVRVEEMINYFDYQYPQPKGEDPISITTEMIDCPWQKGHKLLHIGLQAKTIATHNLPSSNLTFLIDVSGSMQEQNKLPLVISSLKMLVEKLRAHDRLAIVVYAGAAGVVLPPTSGDDKEVIYDALDKLQAGGSTAGGAGIKLAYKTASENFMRGGNNRVILATDGDFNVGVSGDNELEDLITKERDKGIYLTCLGYGMGNYKDSKMEILADKGNGNYAYVDNIKEAEKTLVKEFGGTIFTIAKDVKAQIEFNPAFVKSYRLVGYENRLLNEEDFKDDKKDAGDVGSGHTVTIMYEIIPVGVNSSLNRNVDPLRYQQPTAIEDLPSGGNEVATIKFRYKRPNGNTSTEMVHNIASNTKSIMLATDNIRFASSVAMFGMLLKDSKYKGVSSYDMAYHLAKSAKGKDKEGYRKEYISLVRKAGKLSPVDENEETEPLGWNGVD